MAPASRKLWRAPLAPTGLQGKPRWLPLPRMTAVAAAIRLQRAARAMLHRDRQRQHAALNRLIQEKRFAMSDAAAAGRQGGSETSSPVDSLGVPATSHSSRTTALALEERLQHLQQVVDDERHRRQALEHDRGVGGKVRPAERSTRSIASLFDASSELEPIAVSVSPHRSYALRSTSDRRQGQFRQYEVAEIATASGPIGPAPLTGGLVDVRAPAAVDAFLPAEPPQLEQSSLEEFTRLEEACGCIPQGAPGARAPAAAEAEGHPVSMISTSNAGGCAEWEARHMEPIPAARRLSGGVKVTAESVTPTAVAPDVVTTEAAPQAVAVPLTAPDEVTAVLGTDPGRATGEKRHGPIASLTPTAPAPPPCALGAKEVDRRATVPPARACGCLAEGDECLTAVPTGLQSSASTSASLTREKVRSILSYLDETEGTKSSPPNAAAAPCWYLLPPQERPPRTVAHRSEVAAVPAQTARQAPTTLAVPKTSASLASEDRATTSPGEKMALAGSDRAAELASTVYVGVKHKMNAMKAELAGLRRRNSELVAEAERREREVSAAVQTVRKEAEEQLSAAKAGSEDAVARHLAFIDRLLADKQELNKQCEALSQQVRAVEERCAASEAKREEMYAKELKRHKELWAQGERTRREAWITEKTREIKESTIRGLEPDIQRLMVRHQEETRRLEAQVRDEAQLELAAERSRWQRELARMHELAQGERAAAQEKERELCTRRLAEMTSQFEEQQHAHRLRAAAQVAAEREAADEGRRRDLTRLEEELREVKARETNGLAKAQAAHEEATARMEAEHAEARRQWDAQVDAEVRSRLEAERKQIEEASAKRRASEIETVVERLSGEMAAAANAAEKRLERERANAAAAASEEAQRSEELQHKYVHAIEVQTELEEKLRTTNEELVTARLQVSSAQADEERLQAEVASALSRLEEARQHNLTLVGLKNEEVAAEREAWSNKLSLLRAALHEAENSAAAENAELRRRQDSELEHVEERVRKAMAKKESVIRSLQEQLVLAQTQLHQTQQQLHQTQQEILTMT